MDLLALEIDGRAATEHELRYLALVNYAHFTAMQVRGQIHYGLRAEHDGFDDAVFTRGDGILSEAAIANLGGCRDDTVTWPDAPVLPGITMQLPDRHLAAAGLTSRRCTVRLDGLGSFGAVFLTNSLGISPVGQIDGPSLDPDPGIMKTIISVYESIPWDPI